MRSVPLWVDKVTDLGNATHTIYDLAFRPDGTQLVVAAGNRVLVYDTTDGTLIQTLKGHKETVYCVCYSKDGKRFATGSADKQVIIWTSKLEGILKYSHHDSIHALAYNPISPLLVSCATTDFGLWSPDQKNVAKHRVPGKITCCCWTKDGLYLAVGLITGQVSIRSRTGEERLKIDRPGGKLSAVWGLSWNPNPEPTNVGEDNGEILAVVDWSQTLTFYNIEGKIIGKERSLNFNPLFISYVQPKGDYIFVGGSNKQAIIYSKEGIKIGPIAEQNSWVWCCKTRPDSNHLAVGCQDGTVAYYEYGFSTVHSLYKERYAFRENMTDVIIHNLISEERAKIKCHDIVKKLAIYKHRLAVQLSERIVVYELSKVNTENMHYVVKEKINQKVDCTLLVVCTNHLVLCTERRLQCMSFKGVMERDWLMDSAIRYIKVTGGPEGKEGLLVGLKNGQVVKLFVDNPFPLPILKIPKAIRCLDLSAARKKIAIVDDAGTCLVYDIQTKELLFQEPNANSVAWNSQYEDMLCYSGNGFLNIKAGNFPSHQQRHQGFVVGFCGSKIFCLNFNKISTIDVPQSTAMYQFLEKKMISEGHKVACLGVTDSDWRSLAHSSLEILNLGIARQSYIRLREPLYLQFIQSLEDRAKRNEDKNLILADIYAYTGRFSEAAKLYKKSNNELKALTMFTDLRMFDLAQQYLETDDVKAQKFLMKKKAEWAMNINEQKVAAEMYLTVGESLKAIKIVGENKWIDMLIDIGRKLPKTDVEGLQLTAYYLKENQLIAFAAEIYQKLNDQSSLVKLYVDAKDWDEALQLAEKMPECKEEIFVPYATWLAENDKFVEAQKAFHKAGRQEEALNVLEQLTHNAVNENRFNDAGYYYWLLSIQCLDLSKEAETKAEFYIQKFQEHSKRAVIYYVYHNIFKYIEEPFTSFFPDALFNMCRFLLHQITDSCPMGVSKFSILYALTKQCPKLGAYKLARQAFERIQELRIPLRYQDSVNLETLKIKGKPFNDSEDLLPLCYRCTTTNPILNNQGDHCVNCSQPFLYSFVAFEILPLVEFELEDDIADDELLHLLDSEPKRNSDDLQMNFSQGDSQTLKIERTNSSDPFTKSLLNYVEDGLQFIPVKVNRQILRTMSQSDIIICYWPPPLKNKYYRNLMPGVPISKCNSCNKLFHSDDFEMQMLLQGHCPFCRHNPRLPEGSFDL